MVMVPMSVRMGDCYNEKLEEIESVMKEFGFEYSGGGYFCPIEGDSQYEIDFDHVDNKSLDEICP